MEMARGSDPTRPDPAWLTAAFCLVAERACVSEGVEPSPEARRSNLELDRSEGA